MSSPVRVAFMLPSSASLSGIAVTVRPPVHRMLTCQGRHHTRKVSLGSLQLRMILQSCHTLNCPVKPVSYGVDRRAG